MTTAAASMQTPYLTIKESAARLRVSIATFERILRGPNPPSFKNISRRRVIHIDALDAWVAAQPDEHGTKRASHGVEANAGWRAQRAG